MTAMPATPTPGPTIEYAALTEEELAAELQRERFEIEVVIGGAVSGRAAGRSKKEAEQQAAREALATLKGE